VEYAEHALALEQQTYVSSSSSSSSSLLSFKTINMAKQNLKRAFAWNTLIGILIYWGSSLCIALFTIHLDRRMTMIVIGSSRIFAAVVFCILSFQIPQWFGMYYKAQRRHKIRVVLKESSYSSNSNSRHNNNHNDNHNNNDDERGGSTVSPRAFRFQFSWSLWKQLSTMFFFSLFFSCFTKKFSTLYGILGKQKRRRCQCRYRPLSLLPLLPSSAFDPVSSQGGMHGIVKYTANNFRSFALDRSLDRSLL
jgi:hypothetical protein